MVKIKSGVKLPPRAAGAGRPEKYPFAKMKVGQMFEFPKDIKRSTANGAAVNGSKRYKMKFSVRALPNGIVGCWRVK